MQFLFTLLTAFLLPLTILASTGTAVSSGFAPISTHSSSPYPTKNGTVHIYDVPVGTGKPFPVHSPHTYSIHPGPTKTAPAGPVGTAPAGTASASTAAPSASGKRAHPRMF